MNPFFGFSVFQAPLALHTPHSILTTPDISASHTPLSQTPNSSTSKLLEDISGAERGTPLGPSQNISASNGISAHIAPKQELDESTSPPPPPTIPDMILPSGMLNINTTQPRLFDNVETEYSSDNRGQCIPKSTNS